MHYERNRLEVGCFAGCCHHLQSAMSPHMHAYHYPSLKVEQKHVCEQSLFIEKDIVLCKYKELSKVGFSYNNN